jgi:hypothetical protein
VTGPFGDAPVRVVRDGSTTPQQDMDLSPQLLADFADPDVPGRLRLHSPRPTAAFSRLDSLAGGFPAAEEAARARDGRRTVAATAIPASASAAAMTKAT